ncbi:hypothetical protein [Actinoplanes sp. NPDC049118]|uniref:hypothetical protein n=1 Tax=Actinoplanes sp. NPDC049118 TaxID=3155769 RepID=UPI0033DA00CE
MPPDLLWDDVQSVFDAELMGSLPDLCVPKTSTDDWQSLLDFVASSAWRFEYAEGDTILPLPRAEAVFSRPADAESPALRVWITSSLVAIFCFYAPEEIDFDINVREIRDQEALDVFCEFLRSVGRRLGKSVLMDGEGGNPAVHPVLGFRIEADRVVVEDMPSAPAT